jgi:hypothetical protein
VFEPSELLWRFRNGLSTGGAHCLDCFLDAHSGHDRQAGCYQTRTPDALAAMNGDVLALLRRGCDVERHETEPSGFDGAAFVG